MIVRILGEGQLEVPDDHLQTLERLDRALVEAVEAEDSPRFHTALARLLDSGAGSGRPRPPPRLAPSDLVLPGSDTALSEVRSLLMGEGLMKE
jgi:hypothetical protein